MKQVHYPIMLIMTLWSSLAFGQIPEASNPDWAEVAPGVWKATVGQSESMTLLGAAGAEPNMEALRNLPVAEFPIDRSEILGRQWDWKTALRFPLGPDEEVYGLGVDFNRVRRTGSTFLLHVDHYNSRTPSPGRTHAPVPLYVSAKGYAVLFDTPRYLKVNVGLGVRLDAEEKPRVIDRTAGRGWQAQPRSDSIEALANSPGMDVYVFAGPSPMDAVRRYNLFNGGGALPPKWGLGFLTRTPTRYSADQALAEIREFRANGIPLDMLGLEPGWHDHAYPCSFEWDPTRFPDPAGFLDEVEKLNVRVNLWFNPYISPTAPLHDKLLPYAGTHLVWNGIVPDYTIPEARQIFSDHLFETVLSKNLNAVGGFKVDEVDGYDRWLWPDVAMFPSGRDGEQLRQTYGVVVQRTLYDLFKEQNRRTLGQTRASNAGASRFPFVMYNDNYAFDEYLTGVVNSGFVGVLWSPEVRGSNSGVDMLRRTQAVCFSPLALYNGWASQQKLWTHDEVKEDIRDVIILRLRLLPYFYNTFAQYHYEGTPVIRPLQLVSGLTAEAGTGSGQLDATANPYELPPEIREVSDQYLLGDSLLVAPINPSSQSRNVVLPAGRWYDFYTGNFAGENETIEVTPPLSRIPLFVRDGALIPMIESRERVPSAGEVVPLEVRHYGEAPGRLMLYDDDGETFDYEGGAYSWTELAVSKDGDGVWRGSIQAPDNGHVWSYSDVSWTFMTTP